jgi:hypothetical protein
MASPFFFYLTPLILLHSPLFPNNLPSREITNRICNTSVPAASMVEIPAIRHRCLVVLASAMQGKSIK